MAALTVLGYAEKKSLNISTVYRQIEAGKLDYTRKDGKILINGKKSDIGCKFTTLYPGEPAEHLITSCGHTLYVITGAIKTFKYCPWCSLKINRES